jgi:hypothetical protein
VPCGPALGFGAEGKSVPAATDHSRTQ